jgi:hypothetical protein
MIADQLAAASADYVQGFVMADFDGTPMEGDTEAETRDRRVAADRGRLLLYGALAKADFTIPQQQLGPNGERYPWRAWVTMRRELADELERQLGTGHLIRPERGVRVGVERSSLIRVIDWLIERSDAADLTGRAAEGLGSLTSGDAWKSAHPIFTQQSNNRAVSGYTKLKPLRPFHTPASDQDFRGEIYDELVRGRVVIVDLHLGPDQVINKLSRQIAGHLIERQTEAFTTGRVPPSVQVVIEEAHNLFSKEKYANELDVWVRLAKEGSKLKIGMIYATQEVTGVDHQVLANTKNWVAAHLNNSREVSELGKYYDFKSFGSAIISHEDPGYVRLKTMSSPYIVPVQIERYGATLVNEARVAAGLPVLVIPAARI